MGTAEPAGPSPAAGGAPLGILLGSLHLALVAYVIWLSLGGAEPDWPMYWMLFSGVDFPVGLIYFPMAVFLPAPTGGPLQDWPNFWGPAIAFGLFGIGWWYLIGVGFARLRHRARAQGEPPA